MCGAVSIGKQGNPQAMGAAPLTPQEYELHLKDLRQRLIEHLEGAGGENPDRLLKDAERVLELAETFPDVFRRHRDVEGLVADLLARREQQRFLAAQQPSQARQSGCLLGWLPWRKRPR